MQLYCNNSMKIIFSDISYKNSWEKACQSVDGVVIMTGGTSLISLSYLKSIMKTQFMNTRNIL